MSLPLVSAIVVNWDGREHLETCLGSILASDYPRDRLEVLLVDNGSTDGSGDLVRSRFPGVRLIALDRNVGFTGGNAAGVAASSGSVLAFFNNDMRLEAGAIRALVAALDAGRPCASARVLSWDGRRVDFIGGTINFEARGFQEHYGERWRPQLAVHPTTFFPNGGAFAVTREAYDRAGGFDDRFFAYYDDVDLGWRIRLGGGEVGVAHEAVVYHRHGATSGRFPDARKRFLMERNALWASLKCYDDRTLARVLGPSLLLAAKRIVQATDLRKGAAWVRALEPFSPACRRWPGRRAARTDEIYEGAPTAATGGGGGGRDTPGPGLRRMPVELLAAVGAALESLPEVARDRARLQGGRRADDAAVLPHMGRPLERLSTYDSYRRAQEALAAGLRMSEVLRGRSRLLIVTHEPLGANMSGPGVRALEIGRALSSTVRVTLATPFPTELRDDRCAVAQYVFEDPATIRRLADQADVILLQGFTLARYPFLSRLEVPVVVDLYCPFTIEHLEQHFGGRSAGADAQARRHEAGRVLEAQNGQLFEGDLFLAASERQRDFWLGALHTAGRVNPETYAADPTLRSLVEVVPFGLPDDPFPGPGPSPVLKGAHPGIAPSDRVLIWAGAILDWQDPQTLIRAVARLSARRGDVKLWFMGTRHPNPQVPPSRAVEECRELARSLGLLDTHVFFNDWVPYAERARYLAEADLGLSTHRDHLETRYSFRTRMLDYLWAGLPIVCTAGDHFAAMVEREGLGLVVPAEDDEALAGAVATLLDDDGLVGRCRDRLRAAAVEHRWDRVVEPLRRFCESPEVAADRIHGVRAVRARLEGSFRVTKGLKRVALGLGVSERSIERVKRWRAVQALLVARDRAAWRRARTPRS